MRSEHGDDQPAVRVADQDIGREEPACLPVEEVEAQWRSLANEDEADFL